MTFLLVLSGVVLAIAAVLAVVGALLDRPADDRVLALDTLLYVLASAVAVDAAVRGDTSYLDLTLVLGLLGFLGTVAISRHLEESS